MVKNPPCNAGDMGSIPGRRTNGPYAKEQLSPWATTKSQHSQIELKSEDLKKKKKERTQVVLREEHNIKRYEGKKVLGLV